MASMKCPHCDASSDLRHTVADRLHATRLLPWIAAAAFLAWAFARG